MDASLVLVKSNGKSREISLGSTGRVIGRSANCGVRIPVSDVSREHCEVRVSGDRIVIKDLGSSTGTFVNGERVDEAQLSAGDLVAVGPAVFVLRIDGEPADIDATESYVRGQPAPVAAAGGAAEGGIKSAAASPGPGGNLDDDSELFGELLGADADDSSILDFDFDLNDDDDDQPPL